MRQSLAIFSFVESGITHLMTGVAEQNIFYFQRCSASASPFKSLSLRKTKQVRGIEKSMPFVFHAIRQTCLSGRHGKQKIAVCGLLRSAGLARAPAASRRERACGAKRTASKAWPIPENSIWESRACKGPCGEQKGKGTRCEADSEQSVANS